MTAVVFGIWLGANIWAQALSDTIGATLSSFELHWIATGEIMPQLTPQLVVALLGCAVASWTDVRTGKILNALTLPMIALGLAMNASLGDFTLGIYGCLLAFAFYYVLWLLKLQRGGDAKLWMGLGALLGPRFVIEAGGWYALLYLPVGLLVLLFSGKLGNLAAAMMWSARKVVGQPAGEAPEPTMLRTAPVITAATVAALATTWLEKAFGWTS